MSFESGLLLESFLLSKIKNYLCEENVIKELNSFLKSELFETKFSRMSPFEKKFASLYVATFAPDERDADVKYLRSELRDFDHPFELDGFYHLFAEFFDDHWDEIDRLIIRTGEKFPSYNDSFTPDSRRREGQD